jgi:hypothetical protein
MSARHHSRNYIAAAATDQPAILPRINVMSSFAVGRRPAFFLEKICSPLTNTSNAPGAPARSRIAPPSSRSIWFLRLTASALRSLQKKQRLISTCILG